MDRAQDGRITVEFDDELWAARDSADIALDNTGESRFRELAKFLEEEVSVAPVTLPSGHSDTLEEAFKLTVDEGDFSRLDPQTRLNIDHWLWQIANKES